MFLLQQVNLEPNKILRPECIQNRGKFESIVEMIKRANLLVWRKCVIAYMKQRLFPVFFFQEAIRTVELLFFFRNFCIWGNSVTTVTCYDLFSGTASQITCTS